VPLTTKAFDSANSFSKWQVQSAFWWLLGFSDLHRNLLIQQAATCHFSKEFSKIPRNYRPMERNYA
jgi:hypothetical protein